MTNRFALFAIALWILVPAAYAQDGWRAEAQQRIAEHRMNTLRVVVEDAEGNPVEGAAVEIAMQRQAFGFGTAVSAGQLNNSRVPTYREKLADLTGDGRTFNLAVFENAMKWPNWDVTTRSGRDARVNDILWLLSRGMDFRGHTLLWPDHLPSHVSSSTDPAFVRQAIQDHITSMPNYSSSGIALKHIVRDWDVVNEPVHNPGLRDLMRTSDDYETGEEIYAEAFEWARAADSDGRLFVNDYNIINGSSSERQRYKGVIQDLLDAGAPLGGIGMQSHFNGGAPTMAMVKTVLDDFAQFDLPIAITEYDYTNSGGTVNDAAAANYMRDFLTMVYSHPVVESFVMWGFWDGAHWRDYAPLFFEDWSLKPSGEAFLDLVFDEWWTEEAGTTDAAGTFSVDGHLGTYEVTVTYGSDVQVETEYVLEQGGPQELVFTSTSTAADEHTAPQRFRVEGAYPNPLTDRTTLVYVLPEPAEVSLDVFDLMGRRVQTYAAGWQAAGSHTVEVEAAGLPGGVYVYRLSAAGHSHTGRLHVAR